jgi:hypothetical protein
MAPHKTKPETKYVTLSKRDPCVSIARELMKELQGLRKMNRDLHRLLKTWEKDVELLEARGYPSWIRRPSRRPALSPEDVVLHMASQVKRRLPKEFP